MPPDIRRNYLALIYYYKVRSQLSNPAFQEVVPVRYQLLFRNKHLTPGSGSGASPSIAFATALGLLILLHFTIAYSSSLHATCSANIISNGTSSSSSGGGSNSTAGTLLFRGLCEYLDQSQSEVLCGLLLTLRSDTGSVE